ncbi:MAG: hypothetical protein H0W01_07670 [Pseudonocardiales bacterium]|nr:hypothetical protein [Pseudonocardiales bacterium]
MATVAVAVFGLLSWWAGALWPRLHAEAVSVEPSGVPGSAIVTIVLTNDALAAATVSNIHSADVGPDATLEPTSGSSELLPLPRGGTAELRVQVPGCPLEWGPWTLTVVVYGPEGGIDEDLALRAPPRGSC